MISLRAVLPIMILAVAGYACSSSGPSGPDTVLGVSLSSSDNELYGGGACQLVCQVTGAAGQQVTYAWSASGGTISGSGSQVDWESPLQGGSYEVSCTVTTSGGETASASASIVVFDATLGRWFDLAPVPSDHQEMAAALLDERIYVVGGLNGVGGVVSTVDVYDPASDSWSTAAPLPEARHHAAVAVAGGRIFVFGGVSSNYLDPIAIERDVFMYDPGSNSWTQRASMPTARLASAAVTVGGKIHVVGGEANDFEALTTHEVYDPELDSWSTAAAMPTAREHVAAAAIDSVIYITGGRAAQVTSLDPPVGTTVQMDVLEAYDVRTASWTTLEPMPSERAGLAVAAVDGEIYAFGGEIFEIFGGGAGSRVSEASEVYHPGTDSWRSLAPMRTPRHGTTAVVYEGTVYVIGGGAVAGLSPSRANEAFIPYSPSGG